MELKTVDSEIYRLREYVDLQNNQCTIKKLRISGQFNMLLWKKYQINKTFWNLVKGDFLWDFGFICCL